MLKNLRRMALRLCGLRKRHNVVRYVTLRQDYVLRVG